jgi:hypothetical protein
VRAQCVARCGSIGRGIAAIVARALEVAVSSSSAVLGIHPGRVLFKSRSCGTIPFEPSGPSSLPPTGGANWAGVSGPPFPGGLDGASTRRGPAEGAGSHRPSVRPRTHRPTARRLIIPAGPHRRDGVAAPASGTIPRYAPGSYCGGIAGGGGRVPRAGLPASYTPRAQKRRGRPREAPGSASDDSIRPVVRTLRVGRRNQGPRRSPVGTRRSHDRALQPLTHRGGPSPMEHGPRRRHAPAERRRRHAPAQRVARHPRRPSSPPAVRPG